MTVVREVVQAAMAVTEVTEEAQEVVVRVVPKAEMWAVRKVANRARTSHSW